MLVVHIFMSKSLHFGPQYNTLSQLQRGRGGSHTKTFSVNVNIQLNRNIVVCGFTCLFFFFFKTLGMSAVGERDSQAHMPKKDFCSKLNIHHKDIFWHVGVVEVFLL